MTRTKRIVTSVAQRCDERWQCMKTIRLGMGGVMLGTVALPWLVLMLVPLALQWLLMPFARAAGYVEPTVPEVPGSQNELDSVIARRVASMARRHRTNPLPLHIRSIRPILNTDGPALGCNPEVSQRAGIRVPHHVRSMAWVR